MPTAFISSRKETMGMQDKKQPYISYMFRQSNMSKGPQCLSLGDLTTKWKTFHLPVFSSRYLIFLIVPWSFLRDSYWHPPQELRPELGVILKPSHILFSTVSHLVTDSISMTS